MASEATVTIAAFVTNTYRRSVPTDIAAQRLLLTRWFLSLFLSVDVRIKPYIGGRHDYVGDLISDSANSLKLFPPDALLGWRLGQNVTAVVGDGPNSFAFVTNDEGFASHGERYFHYGLSHSTTMIQVIASPAEWGFNQSLSEESSRCVWFKVTMTGASAETEYHAASCAHRRNGFGERRAAAAQRRGHC